MVRRRLTVKRIDPWSMLKFGFVVNLVLLAVFLLAALVVWFIIDRLAIIDQLCAIALDVGFARCGVNFGNLFQALVLLGLLWVVVQTAVLVFLSFLHNLIADLTGGLAITVTDSTPQTAARPSGAASGAMAVGAAAGTPGPGGPTTGRSTAGTGSPPVPPLRRDPGATGETAPTRQVSSDPEAPEGGESRDSGEVMFGDRPERGGG